MLTRWRSVASRSGRRTLLSFLVAVSAGSLVSGAAASSPFPDPCDLVTSAQAATLIGGVVVSRQPGGNRLYRSCTWTGKNLSHFSPVQRNLMIDLSHSTKAAFVNNAKQQPNAIAIEGVGQLAWTSSGATFLFVYSNGYSLDLSAAFSPSPLATEENAAKIALKRLR